MTSQVKKKKFSQDSALSLSFKCKKVSCVYAPNPLHTPLISVAVSDSFCTNVQISILL